MLEKVFIKNKKGLKLAVIEGYPNNENGKFPVVIFLHGFRGNKNEHGIFDEIALKLNEEGFATFQFDFMGCGESEGDFKDTTISLLKEDFLSIYEYVMRHKKVDPNKIGIFGFSLGANITTVVNPRVNCAVFMNTSCNPKPIIMDMFGEGYNPSGISTRISVSTSDEIKLESEFWIDLNKYDIEKLAKDVSFPVMFINCSEDELVSEEDMKKYFTAVGGTKEFKQINEATHLPIGRGVEIFVDVLSWFKKYL